MSHVHYRSQEIIKDVCLEISQEAYSKDNDASFSNWLGEKVKEFSLPAYLPSLASLEEKIYDVEQLQDDLSPPADKARVNPTLQLFESDWLHLVPLMAERDDAPSPEPGHELILVWRCAGGVRFKVPGDQDLLALKLVGEELDLKQVAKENEITLARLDSVLELGEDEGYLLVPETTLCRDTDIFITNDAVGERYLTSPAFTLQWHITQACDLHCKHCYDRTSRKALSMEEGVRILDDFRAFLKEHHVFGQVTFTGGNPLMYPHFHELYQAAGDRGMQLAILGNPAPKEEIEALLAMHPLEFFQVSLEGMEEHNDEISGKGHFKRVVEFLGVLKELGVSSMVMLTLTRENQGQVLELTEYLRDKVDIFHFNRLAMVGEGADLLSAPTDTYEVFLQDYLKAAADNPCIGYKDNHLNTIFNKEGKPQFGGCTGYGCGAAFNFVSLLAEGEVHACRKFPSYIGNILENTFSEIYESDLAKKYRAGSSACRDCTIRSVCGGCLAVVHGMGLDVFNDKDPYCFYPEG